MLFSCSHFLPMEKYDFKQASVYLGLAHSPEEYKEPSHLLSSHPSSRIGHVTRVLISFREKGYSSQVWETLPQDMDQSRWY